MVEMISKSALLAATVAGSCLMAFTALTEAAPLAGHRAIYDFKIGRNDRNSGYSDAVGRLAYEISGSSCEGWSVNYRFASRYRESGGTTRLTDTQLTSWEAGDGSEMRVNQKYYVDNALNNENKVTVKRVGPDHAVKGELTAPAEEKFDLGAATLFPILYQVKLLDEAARGKTHNAEVVFEGTDGRNAYRVITAIGKQKPGTGEGILAAFKAMPSWPMTTSYYPASDESAEEPIYQSNFTMFENGISTDLMFDYGTYVLKGEISSLEMLPATSCD